MPPCEGGYKEFKIGKLFETPQNSQKIDKLALSNNGSIPVFSSNSTNNGIIGYCDLEPHWKVDEQKPIYLLFGDHTRTFHIAKTDFCITDNVKVLLPKYSAINERVLLYIIAAWKKCIPNLGYARHWSQAKLVKILLPTTSTGEIDFQFMESRIRELEEERVRELEAYLSAAGFANCNLTPAEEDALRKFSNGQIKFKKHTIGKLFEIATGRDIIIGRTQKGQIPLISHQHDNNGITKRIAQISNRRLFNYEDTISLADRGVFLATTQNEDFHIGTRVKALTFLDGKQTNNVRLFFVSAINQLQIMFTEYLSNATDSLPTLEIELPITSKGVVDYDFMETYISAIKKQIIQQLKDFIAKEHAAYQQVIEDA